MERRTQRPARRPRLTLGVEQFEILRVHAQDAAGRHGLIGILRDVVDHLAHLAGVDVDRPQVVGEFEFAERLRAVGA